MLILVTAFGNYNCVAYICINKEKENMSTFSNPTEKALINAKSIYNSPLVKEVFMNGFTPDNVRDHFGVSVQVKRGNIEIIIDYTFTKKTGKMVKSETVETKFTD